MDQVIGAQCRLDSVLCVVDAVHIAAQLNDGIDAADQIAFSDHLVLNKTDDAKRPVDQIESSLRQLNPFAPITRTNRADIPAREVLNRNGFDLDRIEDQLPPSLNHDPDHQNHGGHIDKTGITSVSLTCAQPIDADMLEEWLQDLLARHGTDILRTKGILSIAGDDRKLALQAVNMMLEGDFLGKWGNEQRSSRLVFIGRNLGRHNLHKAFHNCRAAITADA
jgi:G3E family GTPase